MEDLIDSEKERDELKESKVCMVNMARKERETYTDPRLNHETCYMIEENLTPRKVLFRTKKKEVRLPLKGLSYRKTVKKYVTRYNAQDYEEKREDDKPILLEKRAHPGAFIIPCQVGKILKRKAICDLGSNINTMDLSTFQQIKGL